MFSRDSWQRLCWFSFSRHQHRQDSQHPYAGYREVHSHLSGYPSTSAFCLGSQGVGIATPGCGETKVHGCGKQDAVIIQFLFGVIENSRRVSFHHSCQTQWNSYRLPGGFEPGISWVTAAVMHFTGRERLCTWESLQPCGERGQLWPGMPYGSANPRCTFSTFLGKRAHSKHL